MEHRSRQEVNSSSVIDTRQDISPSYIWESCPDGLLGSPLWDLGRWWGQGIISPIFTHNAPDHYLTGLENEYQNSQLFLSLSSHQIIQLHCTDAHKVWYPAVFSVFHTLLIFHAFVFHTIRPIFTNDLRSLLFASFLAIWSFGFYVIGPFFTKPYHNYLSLSL